MAAFEELGLMEQLSIAVDEMNWFLPTPVQQDAIIQILGGSDVMCAAETGAGKTGAFCLPIIQLIYEKANKHVDPKKITAALRHCAMNKDDIDSIQVAENGLNVSAKNVKSFGGARALYGVHEGRYAYTVKVLKGGAGIKVGWAAEGNIKFDLGTDKNGFAYCGAGTKVGNGHEVEYGAKFKKDDVITCLRDVPNHTIAFLKNGKPLGEAFKTPEKFGTKPLFPAVSIQDGSVEVYFGLNAPAPPAEGYKWVEEAKGAEQEKFYADFIRRRAAMKRGEQHTPSCIILEPTLELCQQVVDELHKFVKYIDSPTITISSIFGKRMTNEIVDELKRGVDIIVGTPSRVKQFLEMGPGTLCLTSCDFLVFDEADRLLDSENIQMAKNLYTEIRKTNARRLQLMMFSATLHDPIIQELALQMCPSAVWVDLKGKDFVPDTVHHAIVYADPDDDDRWRQCIVETDGVHEAGEDETSEGPDKAKRMNCLRSHQIKRLKPEILLNVINAYDMEQCLIFCRTRDDCDHLSAFLNAKGGGGASGKMEKGKENAYSNVALHSGFPPRQRAENLDMFKQGDVRFLICTDVAARGIDIKQLPFVINMMLPDKPEDYIHRIGRTGRADRMGMAISIATSKHREKVWYHSNCNRGMRSGRPCTDTRLVEQGGCCIWYNEPAMIKEIEKRCGEELSELDTNYRYANPDADNTAVEYGQSRAEAKMKKSDNVRFIEQHAAIVNILSAKTQGDHLNFAASLKALVQPPAAPKGTAKPAAAAPRGRGGALPASFTAARAATAAAPAPAAAPGVKTLSGRTRNR